MTSLAPNHGPKPETNDTHRTSGSTTGNDESAPSNHPDGCLPRATI